MTLQVFDCEQGTDEWFRCRMGIPTASEFSSVLAKGEGKTRKAYMHKLVGERITGELTESFTNPHMERGHVMEEEARNHYEFMNDVTVERVGFIRNGDVGCSPDGFVSTNGSHEIKTKMPHLHIECMLRGSFPPEHKAQCQGILWVAEREWIDLSVYWPKMPQFVIRAHRDEEYIKTLASEVARFNEELASVTDKIRNYDVRRAA